MGERKVLNKYYPPDFDPSKIPRRQQCKNHQVVVRMMLPMSIRCKCGNYIGKGTKFNTPKEVVVGETYLGISIFRFYIQCTKCSAEITYKTDPQNSDYTVEAGATRNFEPWRSTDEAVDEARKKRVAEEMGDTMKALENRTMDSKQEMDINSTLDELMAMNSRRRALGTEFVLEALRGAVDTKEKELAEEDEAIVQAVVFHNSAKSVRRLEDTIDDDVSDVPTSKKARPSFLDKAGGSKVSTTASLVVSSSQGSIAAAGIKASTFTAKPKFSVMARKNGPPKELLQLASVEQMRHIKQVVTSTGPMLSINANSDMASNDEVPTCLAALYAYDDDGDLASDA